MTPTQTTLLLEHRHVARHVARDYYLPGSDAQDVEQEAMIALWHAVRAYDGTGVFEGFARMVIRRRLGSKLHSALALRHRPLNESLRVLRNEDGEHVSAAECAPGGRDPADVIIARESLNAVAAEVAQLTTLEREVLARVVNGNAYSRRVTGSKVMENAIDRARRKLRSAA